MKLSIHITSSDGNNHHHLFSTTTKEQIKVINKWMLNHYGDRCDILTDGYRISNTAWGTWAVYKLGKWVDTPMKEYSYLGNAVKYLGKIMEG